METFLIILCLGLSAFFSGMEIAFVSANRLRVEVEKSKNLAGKVIANLSQNPSHFIGTLLVGNNIALVIFGMLMAANLEPAISGWFHGNVSAFTIMLIQTIITTLIVLLAGEFLPKVLFRINPNTMLRLFALPMWFFYVLIYPLVKSITWISKQFLEVFLQTRIEEAAPVFTKTDLEHFVRESGGNSSDGPEINADIFENALYLPQVKVRECMIPRTEIIAIDVRASIGELKEKFIVEKVSRILVYDDSIDNILGYVHHHALLKKPRRIKSILFSIPLVPETMPASDLLNLFIKNRKSIAWVVDEFGGTAGVITLEDVIEEIFGEIEDEHDKSTRLEQKLNDRTYLLSARLEIDYLNETYGLNLPEGEYETLAGLIVDTCENIPKPNETIEIGPYRFTILKVSKTRIETVKMEIF